MGDYDKMLARLKEYRKSLGLKQRQICSAMGITQEQYSYLENGQVKLTDENIKSLYDMGLGVDYLITGREYTYKTDDIDRVLGVFTEPCRDFAMKMLAEVIVEKWELGSLLEEIPEDIIKSFRLLEAALRSWESFSMLGFVREDNKYSQSDMVQKLGVGIRKYRELEREERYPDADLLLSLYKISGYPPTMFMNISDRRLLALSTIWQSMKAKEKRTISQFMTRLNKLL